MNEPSVKEILEMFLPLTEFIKTKCKDKNLKDLKAMQYALVSAADAIAEELNIKK